jgi:hypothetical protein
VGVVQRLRLSAHELWQSNDAMGAYGLLAALIVAGVSCTFGDSLRLEKMDVGLLETVAIPKRLCRHSFPPSGPCHGKSRVPYRAPLKSKPLCFAT